MPRLQTLLECVAQAFLESGIRFPELPETAIESLGDIAALTHQRVATLLPHAELHTALREAASASPETVELALRDAVEQR